MKTQSMFLALILGVAGLAAGFLLGRADPAVFSGTPENTAMETMATSTQGTTIEMSSLSEGQRRMLTSVGIDATQITVTPEMAACAEARIGTARVAEIVGGATPTISEGAALFACYSQQ